MTFNSEAKFEIALIDELKNRGWESEVLKNSTEADLLQNWAAILLSPLGWVKTPSFSWQLPALSC